MKQPDIVAKAVYFIDGDENAQEYQSMVIAHENSLWLVATWLESNYTGTRYPDRIVPLASFSHAIEQSGLIRLGLLMPKPLLTVDCPQELLQQFGAVTHPSIAHIPGPSSIQ